MPVTFSVSGDNDGAGLRGEAGAGAGRQAAGSKSRGEDRAGAGWSLLPGKAESKGAGPGYYAAEGVVGGG